MMMSRIGKDKEYPRRPARRLRQKEISKSSRNIQSTTESRPHSRHHDGSHKQLQEVYRGDSGEYFHLERQANIFSRL